MSMNQTKHVKFVSADVPFPSTLEFQQIVDNEIHECELRLLNNSAMWLLELRQCVKDFPNNYNVPSKHSVLGEFIYDFKFVRTLFNGNEFQRCSHFLKDKLLKNNVIDFLYYFCSYKAALKLLRENDTEWNDLDSQKFALDDLITLKEELFDYLRLKNDSFIKYLYGMVLKKLNLMKEAEEVFIETLNQSNYMWCAWFELSDIYSFDVKLPNVWMRNLFDVKCFKSYRMKSQCDIAINYLIKSGYSDFKDLKIDLAKVNEENGNSVYARELLEEIYAAEPKRIDYFQTLSNIYFVQEEHYLLSDLAKRAIEIDKYNPQTCCVIANLYGLRSDHCKAVSYFERALKLDPDNATTWVLTAHEYSELENYHAAVKCYSRAVEIDPRNYRALYGLGQLYEVFKTHKFALACYERAFEVAPHDSRILVAMGSVYEEHDRNEEAKLCYYRAHSIGDIERIALFKLGKIYVKLKDPDHAAASFNLYINEVHKEGCSSVRYLGEACKFMANYHVKYTKNVDWARQFALRCIEIPDTKIEGESIIREISANVCKKNSDDANNDEQYAMLESYELQILPRVRISEDDTANGSSDDQYKMKE